MNKFFYVDEVKKENIIIRGNHSIYLDSNNVYVLVKYHNNSLFLLKSMLGYYSDYLKINKSYLEFIKFLSYQNGK